MLSQTPEGGPTPFEAIQRLSRLFYSQRYDDCLSESQALLETLSIPSKHSKVLLLIYLRSVYELGLPEFEGHWDRALSHSPTPIPPELLVVG